MTDSGDEVAIAVDMGGSHIEYGIVRGRESVAVARIEVGEASLRAVLPELERGIAALAAEAGCELQEMAGVGLGICAIVDQEGRVIATNGKYDDCLGFDFPRWSRDRFGLPCMAENDTRLALLGEHFTGAASGYDDAVLVTMGTGIGGAVMLGGKLMQSAGRKAGGFAGHLGVAWNGRACICGNRGCAEAEASTVALDAVCRERDGFTGSALSIGAGKVDFQRLFAAADAGDRLAGAVLRHCIEIWSALTVSLIHAYDPQVIVFGGGVMRRHEAILPSIREHVNRHAWVEPGSVKIAPAKLGASAALFGALPLLRGRA